MVQAVGLLLCVIDGKGGFWKRIWLINCDITTAGLGWVEILKHFDYSLWCS
jgi:hypothetical protein